jgi:hypothetical protein
LKKLFFLLLLQIDVLWIVYFLENRDDIGVVVTERLTAVLSYTVLHGRSTSEEQTTMAAVTKHHRAYQLTSTETKFKKMFETWVH